MNSVRGCTETKKKKKTTYTFNLNAFSTAFESCEANDRKRKIIQTANHMCDAKRIVYRIILMCCKSIYSMSVYDDDSDSVLYG